MPTSWADRTRRTIQSPERLFVLALLLLSVSIRLINLESPLFTGNTFRQTLTAMTVWTFVDEGISLFKYQTPLFGPPWTIPVEFPLYQLTAALVVKLGVENIDAAGRIAAMLYFYLSACFLFLICQKYLGRVAATCVLLTYVWTPFMIVWSRNFMFDYASVAFSLGYFYFFVRWLDESRRALPLAVSIGLGVLAYLVKVTTLPTVLIPMAYLALKRILPALREDGYHLGRYLREHHAFIACLAAVFLIPVVPFLIWLRYSDAVKAASEYGNALTSASLHQWNFGTWDQKTNLKNWAKIVNWIKKYMLTLPSFAVTALGLPLFLRSWKRGGDFVAVTAAAAPITIFTFFNLYWVHDYYLMAISPAVSIVVGFCLYLVLRKLVDGDFKVGRWSYPAVLIIALTLYAGRDNFMWIFNVSYDQPNATLDLAKAIRAVTTRDDYVIVADVFDWDPQYLYYARRKGFMLWRYEGDKSNEFFKKYRFTTVVHAEPHEKLFSNWKYRKLVGTSDKFKIERVSDSPIE